MDGFLSLITLASTVNDVVAGITSIFSSTAADPASEEESKEAKESNDHLTELQARIDQSEREQKRQREKYQQLVNSIRKGKNQRQQGQRKFNQRLKEIKLEHDQEMKSLNTNREKDRQSFNSEIEKMADKSKRYMQTMKFGEAKQKLQFLRHQRFPSMIETLKDKIKHIQNLLPKYKQINKQVIHEQKHLQKFENELDDKNLLRVVLLGVTGHGKSTFGNRVCGDESEECNNALFKVSPGLNSETKHINKCLVELNNKGRKIKISVVDTPGFEDGDGEDSIHINNLIEWLRGCGGVNAFVVVNHYGRYDMNYQRMLQKLQNLLGVVFWKHVIFMITNVEGKEKISYFPTYKRELMGKLQEDPKLHLQVLQQQQQQQQSNYNGNGRRGNAYNMDEGKMDDPYSDHSQSWHQSRSRSQGRKPSSLPIIGISNITRAVYREKIVSFLSVIPRERFECKSLVSPLNALKLQRNMKLDELLCLLRVKTQKEYEIIITHEQITALEQKLQKAIANGVIDGSSYNMVNMNSGGRTTAVLLDQILEEGSNDAMGIPREMYDVQESLQQKRNPSRRSPVMGMGGQQVNNNNNNSNCPYIQMLSDVDHGKLIKLGMKDSRISELIQLALFRNENSIDLNANTVVLQLLSKSDFESLEGMGFTCRQMVKSVYRILRNNGQNFDVDSILHYNEN